MNWDSGDSGGAGRFTECRGSGTAEEQCSCCHAFYMTHDGQRIDDDGSDRNDNGLCAACDHDDHPRCGE